MREITIEPMIRPFTASITPPGSKSLTNRALVLAALSASDCALSNPLLADDSRLMIEGLRRLGYAIELDESAGVAEVRGRSSSPASAEIQCGNSGTTTRFLAALASALPGSWELAGEGRGNQRPIGGLVQMLRNLGGRIEYLGNESFPPLRVQGHELPGGLVRAASGAASSQFLSAVLMIAPLARNEVIVDLEPNQPSWPYVAMTMRLMDEFGVTPELIRDPTSGQPRQIIVPQGRYGPTNYRIEPDATAASYFLAMAAIHPGSKLTIEGLGTSSLQGDVGFADVLHRMGAGLIFGRDFITITGGDELEGIEVDLSAMPDVAPTLAVVALFARGQTVIRGLRTLRVKETDRLAAVSTELRKLGAAVEIEHDDALIIDPPTTVTPNAVDTYDDHRMAMSFAAAGTRTAGITIRGAQCVSKTYPGFFQDVEKMRKGEIRNPIDE